MSKWLYEKKCMRGISHRERGMLCQDRAAYLERDHMQVAALVDGISQTDKSVIVFEHIADDLVQFTAEHMEELLGYNKRRLDIIKKYLICQIRKKIENYMKQYNLNIEDCASTIMVLGLDHLKNEYLLIHLGDGIILSEEKDEWTIKSYPKNNSSDGKGTYHTVTDSADEKMKIYSGPIGDSVSKFILLTDGNYEYPADKEKIVSQLKDETFWKDSVNRRADDIGIVVFCREEMEDVDYGRQNGENQTGCDQQR